MIRCVVAMSIAAAALGAPAPSAARGAETPELAVAMIRAGQVQAGLDAYRKGCTGRRRFTFRKNAAAFPVIGGVLKSGATPALRAEAAALMRYFEREQAVAALSAALSDGEQSVRTKAATVLGHIGGEAAGAALVAYLERYVERCAEASGAADEDCVYALHGLSLTEASPTPHRDAAVTLARQAAMAPGPKVRELAVNAIDAMKAAEALPTVTGLIEKEKAGGFAKGASPEVRGRFEATAAKLRAAAKKR